MPSRIPIYKTVEVTIESFETRTITRFPNEVHTGDRAVRRCAR